MIVRERVLSTHHLEMPSRGRRYVFRVLEDSVRVERWVGMLLQSREELSLDAARRRYVFIHSLGYTAW